MKSTTLELTIGIVVGAIVVLLFLESFNPLYEGFGQPEFPPMRFPRWILLGIGFLTSLHIVRVLLGKVETDPIFHNTQWVRTGLVVAVSLCGALLIKPLGFSFASAITFWVIALILGFRNYMLLTVFTVIFVIGVWALFTFVISIGLPTSPFFNRI